MNNFNEILPIAKNILAKNDLCDNCLGRLFSRQLHLSSNKLLGNKIRKKTSSSSSSTCYICKNLMSNLKRYINLMLETSRKFEYSTFLVGAIIKPSIVDRDDYIRSKYKMQGVDSVKTDITKELSKKFVKITKQKIDFSNPDITFSINLRDETCDIRSKSIFLQGRYTKNQRGFPQKQKACANCSGRGCRICNYHGILEFESIEGKIAEYIFSKFGGTTAKFTWFGGEDISSLVLGSGRPFIVKLQNPLKRNIFLPKKIKLDFVQINNCKLISKYPKILPKFISVINLKITTKYEIESKNLRKLKRILNKPIIVYEKSGKKYEKIISNLKYKKNSKTSFTMFITVESGFPIKRFIESNDVIPGVSQILENSCSCDEFDFHKIEFKS